MLILSRKAGEAIVVEDKKNGHKIELKVVGVHGDIVRVGVKAPENVEVFPVGDSDERKKY